MSKLRIFIDTAELDQIKDAVSTGLVDGVATNPNKIAESGKTYPQVLEEIRAFFDGPIAFQSMGNTTEEIIKHALEIHSMDPKLAVKVVADKVGLPAIKPLVLRAASAERCARFRTSSATTAKPLPASPARAASTAAFKANRLVWKAISSMVLMIREV